MVRLDHRLTLMGQPEGSQERLHSQRSSNAYFNQLCLRSVASLTLSGHSLLLKSNPMAPMTDIWLGTDNAQMHDLHGRPSYQNPRAKQN